MKSALATALIVGTTLAATTTNGDLTATAAQPCERLASLAVPNGRITLAQTVGPGSFAPPTPAGAAVARLPAAEDFRNLPAFCRVAATLTPTRDSDIKIEVWMPAASWNGKLQAVGNSGWLGAISYAAMANALTHGYATTSTDTGHVGDTEAFAFGHPEKYVDFGYRAVHEMTVTAKAIVPAYYETSAKRSYWNGCSAGGRQGLMEAQRFPTDFDGIIAGAPANARTTLTAFSVRNQQALLKNDESFIPPAKYQLIHQAVLRTCDSLDGVTDGLIADPPRCHFDPQVLQCNGSETSNCLTRAQVESIRTLLSPAKSQQAVEEFPGYEPGSELDLADSRAFGDRERIAESRSFEHFRYVVFNDPNWDWHSFNFDRDVAKAKETDHGVTNATSPDLLAFARHGGKLLMYHGWADGAIPPRASVNYYANVVNRARGRAMVDSWMRLFMVPGMYHCRGGEGPNTFDVVGALDQWVEQGKAPDRMIASHASNGIVDRTRPLCPYPQVAVYHWTGSIDDAVNFTCKAQ
jgi:tannase/feruloyl esterase